MDGEALRYRAGARLGYQIAPVVRAVAGDVDHLARAFEAVVLEQRGAVVDGAADRGVMRRAGPALLEGRREGLGRRRRVAERSEERRVGNECASTCISRWSPSPEKTTHPTTPH